MAFTLSQPSYGQAGSYTALQDRFLIKADVVSAGVRNLPSAIANTSYSVGGTLTMQGDLAVTVNTSPASTVAVAAGDVWIDGGSLQGFYYAYNDASLVSAAFASNAAGNPRIDLVTVQVTDTGLAAPSVAVAIVQGTAAASPTAPATPAKAVALAQVTIPNGFVSGTTNVLAANIVDVRPKAQLWNTAVPNTTQVSSPSVGNIVHDGNVGTVRSYNSLSYIGTSATSLAIGTGAKSFTTQAGLSFAANQRVRAISAGSLQNFVSSTTTSTSSVAIGTGSKTFTTAASGLAYVVGTRVRVFQTGTATNYMEGAVTSYSGTTLVVNVDATGGTGTIATWTIVPLVAFMEGVVSSYSSTTLAVTMDTTNGGGTATNPAFTDWLLYGPAWEQDVKATATGSFDNTYRYVPTVISPSTVSPLLPFEGGLWYQTDTDRLLSYTGTAWQRISSNSVAGRTGCTVRRNATQSIPSTVTRQGITFDVEDVDTDNFFTGPSTDITIPAGLGGLYGVSFTIWWDTTSPGTSSYSRLVIIPASGNYGVIDGDASTGAASNYGGVPFVTGNAGFWVFSAGDKIQVFCSQQSGAAITVTARVQLYRIGV